MPRGDRNRFKPEANTVIAGTTTIRNGFAERVGELTPIGLTHTNVPVTPGLSTAEPHSEPPVADLPKARRLMDCHAR